MDESIGQDTSTRRGLLRALARTAARHAQKNSDLLAAGRNADAFGTVNAPNVSALPARRPARAPARGASSAELLALAHAEGLTQREAQVRALAGRSLRMTAAEHDRAGAWILTDDDWASTRDDVLLAAIDLGAVAEHDCGLPDEGWLALFVASEDTSTDSGPRRAHGILLDMPVPIPMRAQPVVLHPELVLPRRWHEAVQTLDLDDAEAEAYDRVRAQLQALQGVEDDRDGGAQIAYHRLFGYPNETTGSMPLDCVRARREWLAAEGIEPDPDDPPQPWETWRLLVQVSVGDQRRAYVWIHRADLDEHELDRLCAFVT